MNVMQSAPAADEARMALTSVVNPCKAPIPILDAERLAALERYHLTELDPRNFDLWVELAQQIFRTKYAVMSVVERDRQWFKAQRGLTVRQTSRDVAFCAHTILRDEALIVENSTLDPRFRENPLVTGDPQIRFYAGVPLITPDGYALGALCVFDPATRWAKPDEVAALSALRDSIMIELERDFRERQETGKTGPRPRGLLYLDLRLRTVRQTLRRCLTAVGITQYPQQLTER